MANAGDTDGCPGGAPACGGICVDNARDASHCGSCGVVCGAGEGCCNSSCIDLQSDAANCGACGNACDVDGQCLNGLCADCDVLAQDCADPGDACFANVTTGTEFCAVPFLEGGTGLQGESCAFVNGCAEGYGCALDTGGGALVCAFFCDADGMGGPACSDGPGPSFDCLRINDLYANAMVRNEIGICVPGSG